MAFLYEYELTDDMGNILSELQIAIFGKDRYYADGICETWNGIEDIADRYGFDQKESPYLVNSFDVENLSCEKKEEMLFDSTFAPYIECIRSRELPAAEPGRMYMDRERNVRSFSEITWHERIARQIEDCRCCRGTEYNYHLFPLVVEEDDGSVSTHWTWCENIWSDMGDDIAEIVAWEGAEPRVTAGRCPNFEWS